MDRRTILAIILSAAVLVVGFIVQSLIFAPGPEQLAQGQTQAQSQSQSQQTGQTAGGQQAGGAEPSAVSLEDLAGRTGYVAIGDVPPNDSPVEYTDGSTYRAVFSRYGGALVSFKLLQHLDGNEPVDMILSDKPGEQGLQTYFGTNDGQLMNDIFNYSGSSDGTLVFWRDYVYTGAGQEEFPFRVTKTYRFVPGEYMFELSIRIENLATRSVIPPVNAGNVSYTLNFGPEIGPSFQGGSAALPGQTAHDIRRFITFSSAERKVVDKPAPGTAADVSGRQTWTAIDGKYFALVVVPANADFKTVFESPARESGPAGSQISFERGPISASSQQDTYRIYAGPRQPEELAKYNDANKNQLGISGLRLNELADFKILGWLESIMKYGLQFFYNIVYNWGLAIILLTVLVKLLMYPLTKKSHESTRKMQSVQPKLKELQEKHKDNPQKLNQAMADLYRAEGINPLGGCLPMLIQMPFLFAMYGLFSDHFDLRGASFIPGWISDLSQPDVVLQFGFQLPLLNWSALHLLPFIYLGSQLLYGLVTQQPQGGAQASSQKIMMFALPIVFFFILYEVPSGLLVFWIFQNIVTMIQQLWVNRKHRPAAA